MTDIPAEGELPIIDRLLPADKKNERILQLMIAFNKVIKQYCEPLAQRLQNLQSYWTANEEDLRHLLKRDFGDFFGDITVSAEEKRMYLWNVFQTPFFKHSLELIEQTLVRLNLPDGCVQVHRYFWDPDESYVPVNRHPERELVMLGEDLNNYVALSELELRFDEYRLSLSGHNTETAIIAVQRELRETLPYHIQVEYTILESNVSFNKSLVLAEGKHHFQTITLN